MRIGEFAEICETKISILRHYDKEGLITPEFTDRFTGYRYYSASQIIIYKKITVLKKSGFSLKEIKNILSKADNTQIILDSISRKKSELIELLSNLDEAKLIMLGVENMYKPIIIENENGIEMRLSVTNLVQDFRKACEQLEEAAHSQDYQRISSFKTFGDKDSEKLEIRIDIVKLNTDFKKMNDDINLPFVNDDIVGKWEVIGEFAVKDDFFADCFKKRSSYGDVKKELYFLPNGERYWCYGWTKGFLICDTGDGTALNSYDVEEYKGERYMFIQNKSYYYRRGGKPTVLVLRQIDNKEYTSQGLARKDDINMQFTDDKDVIGKWESICYLRSKEKFDPEKRDSQDWLYFKSIEFSEGGKCTSVYGKKTIAGDDKQVWTKGYVLRKWNSSACAYEILRVKDTDYLIIEWKSGDYRWGGFKTDYYVFIRQN